MLVRTAYCRLLLDPFAHFALYSQMKNLPYMYIYHLILSLSFLCKPASLTSIPTRCTLCRLFDHMLITCMLGLLGDLTRFCAADDDWEGPIVGPSIGNVVKLAFCGDPLPSSLLVYLGHL